MRALAAQQHKAKAAEVVAATASSGGSDDFLTKIKADAAARVAARRAGKPVPVAPTPPSASALDSPFDTGVRRSSRTRLQPSTSQGILPTLTQPPVKPTNALLSRLLAQRTKERTQGTSSEAMDAFSAKILADVESGDLLVDDHEQEDQDGLFQRKSDVLAQQQDRARVDLRTMYTHWSTLGSLTSSTDCTSELQQGNSDTPSPSKPSKSSNDDENEDDEDDSQDMRALLAEVQKKQSPKRSRTSKNGEHDEDEESFRKRRKSCVDKEVDVFQLVKQDAEMGSTTGEDATAQETIRHRMFFHDRPITLPTQVPRLVLPNTSSLPAGVQQQWAQLHSYAFDATMLSVYLDTGYLTSGRLGLEQHHECASVLGSWLLSLSLLASQPLASSAPTVFRSLMMASAPAIREALIQGAVRTLPDTLLQLGATKEAVGFAFPFTIVGAQSQPSDAAPTQQAPYISRIERAQRVSRALDIVQDSVPMMDSSQSRINLVALMFRLGMDPFEAPVVRCRLLMQNLIDGCSNDLSSPHVGGLDDKTSQQQMIQRVTTFMTRLPLTEVFYAAIHLLPLGSEQCRLITRRIIACCVLRYEDPAAQETDPDVAAATRCAILSEQAVNNEMVPGNPFAAQRPNEQPDWIQVRAAAHLTSYIVADMRALRPAKRMPPCTSSTPSAASIKPTPSTRTMALTSPGSFAGATEDDLVLQAQRTALLRLESALRTQSGRISDNNGAALERSLARDALLRTSLELRYLMRAAGAKPRGAV